MNDPAGDLKSRGHSLSDWLTLHELDAVTCRRFLDTIDWQPAGAPAAHEEPNSDYPALDPEVAWVRAAEGLRTLFPEHQGVIDDTFEKSEKIIVDQGGAKSPKGLTLDNGPEAYPTIVCSYRGEPSGFLVMAHEFGHAVQIRASHGKFVPPVLREVCAFLSESALLSHTRQCDPERYTYLLQVWHEDNNKYLGAQRDRLQAALRRPDAPYKYFWNYPIARHLAIQISRCGSPDWIWSLFEARLSVNEILRELALLRPRTTAAE